jgi:hypothetical protein
VKEKKAMDEQKILNAICKCLQILANFNPPIVDKNGNAVADVSGRQPPLYKDEQGTPAKNIKDVYVKDIYKSADSAANAANPPFPVPPLQAFVECVKAKTCDFPLEPQQLVNGDYPTIGGLAFLIKQNCP